MQRENGYTPAVHWRWCRRGHPRLKRQVGCGKKWPGHFEALATPSLCIWGSLRIVGLCERWFLIPRSQEAQLEKEVRREIWEWTGSNLPNSGAIRKKMIFFQPEHSLTKWSLPSFIRKLPHTTGDTQAPQPEVRRITSSQSNSPSDTWVPCHPSSSACSMDANK